MNISLRQCSFSFVANSSAINIYGRKTALMFSENGPIVSISVSANRSILYLRQCLFSFSACLC